MECERRIERFDISLDEYRRAACRVITETVDIPKKCEKFCLEIAEKIRVLTKNCEILTYFCDIENGKNTIKRGKICDITVRIKGYSIDENIAFISIIRTIKSRCTDTPVNTYETCFLFDERGNRPIPNQAYRHLKCVKTGGKRLRNVRLVGTLASFSELVFFIDGGRKAILTSDVISEYSHIVRKAKKRNKGIDNHGEM